MSIEGEPIGREHGDPLLGRLMGLTSGWDNAPDLTIDSYSDEIAAWTDLEAATQAIDEIINTWDRSTRPTFGVLQRAYQGARRRIVLERPTLTSAAGLPLSIAEGRQIAARAYADERRRQGKEPNWEFFDRFAGLVRTDPEEAR